MSFQPNILFPAIFLGLWTVTAVAGLRQIDLWNFNLLKDTVLWFFGSALISSVTFVGSNGRELDLQTFILDNLKFAVFLEFVINFYTFPLWIELLLVLVLMEAAITEAFAKIRKDGGSVAKFSRGTQIAIGLVLLGFMARQIAIDPTSIINTNTGRTLLLPFLLSLIAAVPAIYLISLYGNYELLFIRLKMGREKTHKVKAYAMLKMFLNLGLSRDKALRFLRGDAKKLMSVQTKHDVDVVFRSK